MTDHDERKNRHFILGGFTETERFRRPLQKVERGSRSRSATVIATERRYSVRSKR